MDYYQRWKVPQEQWSGKLAVFAGQRWWTDKDQVLQQLEPTLQQMTASGGSHQTTSLWQQAAPFIVGALSLLILCLFWRPERPGEEESST